MKIGIVGCGYVGLSTALNLAIKGFECVCHDINEEKINKLNNGKLPFYEKGLQEVFDGVKDKLSFTTDMKTLTDVCDTIFFAINTPSNDQGRCHISFLREGILNANACSEGEKIFIVKSTCEAGTTERMQSLVKEGITMIFSPEFLAQGQIVENITRPQRMVFGVDSNKEKVMQVLETLYAKERKEGVPIIYTTRRTAELVKYACNSFLAMKISFINKISQLSEKLGADIGDIEQIMKLDCRIGNKYLSSGIGFGGSCFPKDLRAIKFFSEKNGVDSNLINDIIETNEKQIDYAVEKVCENIFSNKVLVLGTTFKKDTSDISNSPALKLISKLVQNGMEVSVYDVVDVDLSKYEYVDKLKFIKSFENCTDFTDIIVASDWEVFKKLSTLKFNNLTNIFDFKRIINEPIPNCIMHYIGKGK